MDQFEYEQWTIMAQGGGAQRILSEAGNMGHCRPREVIIAPITIKWYFK